MKARKNIAVFASGRGSNFQAIVDAIKKNKLKASLKLLVCDNPKALCLKKAKTAKVKALLIERKNYSSKDEFEAKIIDNLRQEKIDLIVLAGFMRIIGSKLINSYKNRIINIHPAILPSFKGARAIADAFNYGVKVTGVTVHFVDEQTDHGPIILQKAVYIEEKDTPASLEKKIHALEHMIYPEAIKLFLEKRLRIAGRKVKQTRITTNP